MTIKTAIETSFTGTKQIAKDGIKNTFTISCKRELRLNVEFKLGKIEELSISKIIFKILNIYGINGI